MRRQSRGEHESRGDEHEECPGKVADEGDAYQPQEASNGEGDTKEHLDGSESGDEPRGVEEGYGVGDESGDGRDGWRWTWQLSPCEMNRIPAG